MVDYININPPTTIAAIPTRADISNLLAALVLPCALEPKPDTELEEAVASLAVT